MTVDFGLDIRHLKDKNWEQIVAVKDCFNNKVVLRKDNPLYHMLGGFTKDGHQNAERVLAIADECYSCEINNYKKDMMLSQYFYDHNVILSSLQSFNDTQITEYTTRSLEYLIASIINTDQIDANNDIIISSDVTEIIFKL